MLVRNHSALYIAIMARVLLTRDFSGGVDELFVVVVNIFLQLVTGLLL